MSENGIDIRREYELIYILQPEVDDATVSALNQRLTQFITDNGGEVDNIDLWGRRTLGYMIKNHKQGHYVLANFILEPHDTDEMERILRFNENVLRYMLTRRDE